MHLQESQVSMCPPESCLRCSRLSSRVRAGLGAGELDASVLQHLVVGLPNRLGRERRDLVLDLRVLPRRSRRARRGPQVNCVIMC